MHLILAAGLALLCTSCPSSGCLSHASGNFEHSRSHAPLDVHATGSTAPWMSTASSNERVRKLSRCQRFVRFLLALSDPTVGWQLPGNRLCPGKEIIRPLRSSVAASAHLNQEPKHSVSASIWRFAQGLSRPRVGIHASGISKRKGTDSEDEETDDDSSMAKPKRERKRDKLLKLLPFSGRFRRVQGRKRRKRQKVKDSILAFDLTPKDVVEYLDRYVVRQHEAKKALAVAICKHYNHCRRFLEKQESGQEVGNYAKPNILLMGPTGVGKTYIMKTIAALIGVPFVKGDATKLTASGLVGKDAEELVKDLYTAASEDSESAQFGIIYVDEVDKITVNAGSSTNFGDNGGFNTRDVQNELLKLLEDTDASFERGFLREKGILSTANILFIFSGAFVGLDEEIRRRKEKKSIGFLADDTSLELNEADSGQNSSKTRSYLRFAETKDFISAGLTPEFAGRIPVRVALDALDADDLKEILTRAEGSILDQFVDDFTGYSINMSTSDAALTQVARLAAQESTGARALVTVLERTLRGHMYQLPSTTIKSFELDNATVVSPAEGLAALLSTLGPIDERTAHRDDLKRWERYLKVQVSPLKVALTEAAIDHLLTLSNETDKSPYWFARQRYERLPDMLQKVAEKIDRKHIFIDLDIVEEPGLNYSILLNHVMGQKDNT